MRDGAQPFEFLTSPRLAARMVYKSTAFQMTELLQMSMDGRLDVSQAPRWRKAPSVHLPRQNSLVIRK